MAVASACAHSFKMIKSDSTLIQWTCNLCHSGPHWWIFECRYCKIHTCQRLRMHAAPVHRLPVQPPNRAPNHTNTEFEGAHREGQMHDGDVGVLHWMLQRYVQRHAPTMKLPVSDGRDFGCF
ncbi:hypothetical protein GCG54_00013311 [Colletotrichum gloeosporioides]|uniref:Uncharacterized protein n=1 Tax=Colletotrichum gloeosporioides TaxID=474922 RepID=A0A8H4CFS2_COLGL|nr:uncharacterized protein GCG54_00013311 [Colletotrichum gloeosporioides]KAF3803205.1 hypothetical protein GCG54_00013311 [Colletotrichum gloeosporioides]